MVMVKAVPTIATPTERRIALHVAALRCEELANGVGYLARRYADKIDEVERAMLTDCEHDLREVAASLTEKAEAAG